jgi:hypothetical protein
MKKFESIIINFVNANQQRYDTLGDYYIKNGQLYIKITKHMTYTYGKVVRNHFFEFLILIHEIVEVLLVIARNISIEKIDLFDLNYQGDGEPGDEKKAPYRKEHQFATKIEKMMAKELKVHWDEYN